MSFFVHETAIVEDGCILGDGVKVWHFAHLMPCNIGRDSIIGQNVFIAKSVILGKNVHVQNNVSIYEGVTCEDDVFLGPSVVFTNVKNPRSTINRKNQFQKTIIKKGATIGANATLICGIEVGIYSFVGAGSVVTKNVSPYALVMGNPARQTGWVSENGHKLSFDKDGWAICPDSNIHYRLDNGHLMKVNS